MDTLVVVLAVLVGLMVLFWGSRVGPRGLRITFFGLFTFYEANPLKLWKESELRELIRREVRAMFPPTDEEEDDEEDEVMPFGDGRDLWDLLEAAGFTTIDENRDLRLMDSGNIDWSSTEYGCNYCKGKVFQLWELYRTPSPSPNLVGRVKRNPLGHVCAACGWRTLLKDEVTEPVGTIGPTIDADGVNFFDVLAHFEWLQKQQRMAVERNVVTPQPEVASSDATASNAVAESDATGSSTTNSL